MPVRRRRKARKPRQTQGPAAPRNDLKSVSRAQLGADPEKRPVRPPADDASMEDPLHDWPEDDR
jgi:hypothetical protein